MSKHYPEFKRFAVITLFTALGAIAVSAPAKADQEPFPTSIVGAPTAPVSLTRCLSSHEFSYVQGATGAVNRSDLFLVSYTVRWKIYDHSNTNISQGDTTYEFKTDLAPGDSTAGSESIVLTSEVRFAEVSRVKCRLQSAKFEGGKTWTYGHQWHGKLSPMDENSKSDESGDRTVSEDGRTSHSSSNATTLASLHRNVALNVTNAWNDTADGNLFVHVAIDISAKDQESLIAPGMLKLSMALANGATKAYPAMSVSAPTYQKINPLTPANTTTAYEVDPKVDLGRLGSISIPAHGVAHIVATFLIGSDPVSNANENRSIALQ